jgi:hypothetical protein
LISAKKNEPDFLLEWRLKAYHHWAKLKNSEAEPKWANIHYAPIDYQDMIYYSAPKTKAAGAQSLEEVDPKLLETYPTDPETALYLRKSCCTDAGQAEIPVASFKPGNCTRSERRYSRAFAKRRLKYKTSRG